MQLGIDFGTCFSSACLRDGDRLIRVKNPFDGTYSFPSSIYMETNGTILIGSSAEHKKRLDPSRYRDRIKPDLAANVPIVLGDREITPVGMAAAVLAEMRKRAEETAAGAMIDAVVLTVPATYNGRRRGLMMDAAAEAGFDVTRISMLEEPVAAALYYVRGKGSTLAVGDIVLTYDLGGGTFDAALIRSTAAGYETVGVPRGIDQCGGNQFDGMIARDVLSKLKLPMAELLADYENDRLRGVALGFLAEFCTGIKHKLTDMPRVEDLLTLPGRMPEEYVLDRQSFQEMIAPHIAETIACCQDMVKGADLTGGMTSVSGVLLIGGSCRIPFVGELVARGLSVPVLRVDDPELSVSAGATGELQSSANSVTINGSPVQSQGGFGEQAPTRCAPNAQDEANAKLLGLWTGQNGHLDYAKGAAVTPALLLAALRKGAAVNARNDDGYSALICAAEAGNITCVSTLVSSGADVNAQDSHGRTALLIASSKGHAAIAKLLVAHGADVHMAMRWGFTPLMAAAKHPSLDVATFLLARGAKVDTRSEDGQTPLHCAAIRGHAAPGVVALLISHGADINARKIDGYTVLHHATSALDAKLLIDRGADVNARSDRGITPLHWAYSSDVVATLVTHGADMNARDDSGMTPLHWTSGRGHRKFDVAKRLIALGADVGIRDNSGLTALETARKNNRPEIIQLLEGKPPTSNISNAVSEALPAPEVAKHRANPRPEPAPASAPVPAQKKDDSHFTIGYILGLVITIVAFAMSPAQSSVNAVRLVEGFLLGWGVFGYICTGVVWVIKMLGRAAS